MEVKIKTTWKKRLSSKYKCEKTIDAIISCFTKEELEIINPERETDSFRDVLLAYNRHKKPCNSVKDTKTIARDKKQKILKNKKNLTAASFADLFEKKNNWKFVERFGVVICIVGGIVGILGGIAGIISFFK